jgi:large subunit ribosomal protein L32
MWSGLLLDTMAKHPVPKKKMSKARMRTRHTAFQLAAQKRLSNAVQLTKCDACGEPRRVHFACPSCGTYRGRKIVDMAVGAPKKNVQKIKV